MSHFYWAFQIRALSLKIFKLLGLKGKSESGDTEPAVWWESEAYQGSSSLEMCWIPSWEHPEIFYFLMHPLFSLDLNLHESSCIDFSFAKCTLNLEKNDSVPLCPRYREYEY